jgi:hypothetical protein
MITPQHTFQKRLKRRKMKREKKRIMKKLRMSNMKNKKFRERCQIKRER